MEFLYLTAQERVDLTDLQFAALDSQLGALTALPQALLTSSQKQRAWIISGFTMSNPGGQVLTVSGGTALLSMRQGAVVTQGLVFQGTDPVSVDLTTYSAGTYNVYVRCVLSPGALDTRTFWQAAGNGQEYAASVPTRYVGAFEVSVSQSLPGAEYLQIGSITVPSMATVDMRPLYFEGRIDQATASGWGTGTDRSNDRGTYGISDLQTALSAIRQGLEEIKGSGLARWYTNYVAGQTIGYAGTAVLARTSWADANFYAQGDANQPTIAWSSDGANLAYVRALGLMQATGPDLPTIAGSATTALAFRSGPTDNALIRGAFYRSGSSTGKDAVDASLSRGLPGQATGGLGLYGASGLMGGAGVGLGYTLGGQAPGLFVSANNLVGIGHARSNTIANDPSLPLQFTTYNNIRRAISFNDGGTSHFQIGFNNVVTGFSGIGTYYGGVIAAPLGDPIVFTQNGNDYGSLKSNVWAFGAQASTSLPSPQSLVGSVNITNSPSMPGTPTSVLTLNNNNTLTGSTGSPYDASIAFLAAGRNYYNVSGGHINFTIQDVVNNVNVLQYNNTTKYTSMPGPIAPQYIEVTQGLPSAFSFNPPVSVQTTLPGTLAKMSVGSISQSPCAAYQTMNSVGNQIIFSIPVQAMTGQQVQSFGLWLSYLTGGATMTYTYSFLRTDMQAFADNGVFISSPVTVQPNPNGTTVFVNGNCNNEISKTNQCWSIYVAMNSSASFSVQLRCAIVNFITPTLNPQRQ